MVWVKVKVSSWADFSSFFLPKVATEFVKSNARYQCAVSPRVAPTASHEYLCCLLRVPMLPRSTCYRPRPPRLRGLPKEAPEILCYGLLYHSRTLFRPFF